MMRGALLAPLPNTPRDAAALSICVRSTEGLVCGLDSMVFSLIGPASPKWCERRHRIDRARSPECGMVRPGRYNSLGNGTIAFEFDGKRIGYGEWIDAR